MGIATVALGVGIQFAAAQSSIDVGVLLPDSKSSARWEADDRRFLQQAFDAAGVKASIVNAEGDAQTQTTQAEQAITNGAKVLLLVDLDAGSGAAIIAKAHDAGVKVIDYDRLTLSDATAGIAADFYVSFDNVSVGKLQGQGLVDAVKAAQAAGTADKEVNVAFLNGSPTDNNATLFAQGAHSVIDPLVADADSGWKIVAEQAVPGWDNQQALVIFEQMQTDHPEINAALAANDGLGQAVISARENAKLGYIPVTGQDATAGGIQNVLAGKQSMTVYKAVKQEADAASALAIALVKGTDTASLTAGATTNNGAKDVPSVLLVPVAVTKDNVADTVIADGFRTWAEICVGDFVQYCPAGWDATPEATMATAEATP
jgi:D-xylose transport system substrate-binding protein